MARGSWGYTGGRDYGYPDAGGGGAYGGRAPAYQVPELGAPAEALNSITELAKMMKERRDKQEKAAREAEAEFRRVTVDVPQGFVVAASQRVGGLDTPEKKTATAWEAQRAWNEEKDRQKHSAEQSRMIEASRKELEASQKEVRQEGLKRRGEFVKEEGERQKLLSQHQREVAKFGARASQARDRDMLAAAKLGEEYDPAGSTFYEQKPDMPTRTVPVYDVDWNPIDTVQLPVTDRRNFIRAGAPGQDEIFGRRPGGREELPGGEPVLPPARRPAAAPPAAATSAYAGEPTAEPAAAPTGRPKSRFDVIREGVLAKKAKEEQKVQEGEDKAWNVSFQKAQNALRAQEAEYKKYVLNPERDAAKDPSVTIPTPDEAIQSVWDWNQGQPPTAEEIRSGKVGPRIPKRMQPPQVPGVEVPAAHVPTATADEAEAGRDVSYKQWEEGVTMGLEKERAAGRDPEAYLLRMESAKFGPETAQITAQARRIAKTQGQNMGNQFLARMGELQKTKEAAGKFEPGTYEKAAAFTSRYGIPLAATLGTALIPGAGPFLAGPAGAASGVFGEQLAREIEGGPEMTGGEKIVTGALGMLGAGGAGAAVGKGVTQGLTKEAIKRAALESTAYGALGGGLGTYGLAATGAQPHEAGLGEIATGTTIGAGVGGVLGTGLTAFAAKFMGPKAAKAVAAQAAEDPEVQQIVNDLRSKGLATVTGRPEGYVPQTLDEIAEMVGQLPPDAPEAQALRERMHVLAAEAGPSALPGRTQKFGFESYPTPPKPGEPGFIGPAEATMEQRLTGARGAAPDLLAQLTEEAGNVPGGSRFIGPMQEPGQPLGPELPDVGGAAPEGLALQPGLRTGSEALTSPELNAQAEAAARKAELDALVAKKPWMREGRGEEAALVGEALQGPLLPGQTSVAQQVGVTPGGIQLPEGVRPPSPKAVARAGEARQPGSQEHFNLWLAENHRITPERWDEMLQSPDATAQVDQLISAYNASNKQAPEVPSFAGFLETKGINKGEWDRLLQSEAPDATAKVDSLINEYNQTAGLSDEGGPNPLLENAPMAQEPVAGRLQEARAAEGKPRGSQLGLSDEVSDQIEYLQNEAEAILDRRESFGERKTVRGQSPEQIKADSDRLARINMQIDQLTTRARQGREVTPPQAAVPTLQVNAQLARTNAALDAAEAALQKGGVTTQRRFPNEARRGVGEGGGAQPFEETPAYAVKGEAQNVPRGEFDVALANAENEVGALRAAAVATKNVPEVTNAIKAAAQEAENRLSKLKKVPDVGKGAQRPTMAIRNTAEALGITREGLARNPQDRTLQTRARMLEERLSDLVNQGQQNRYRATRGANGKYFVMRDATPEGAPREGKVPRTRERAIAGPFKDADQAAQFAAELEARWADVQHARGGGTGPMPTLPKGAPPVKGQKKAGLKQVPVMEFADQRALERAEKLAVTELQHEWATAGRAAPGGRWEFPGQVPEPGLGRSKAVATGAVPRKLRAEFTRAGQLGKIKEALRALKLRKAQGLEPTTPPFEQAPTAPRPSGGGATAEFLGLGTVSNLASKVASTKFVKALARGPRHTLRVLTEDFGATGKKLAQKVLEYQDRYHEIGGAWKEKIQGAIDMVQGPQPRKELIDFVEGNLIGPPRPEVQRAARIIRPVLDEVAKLADTNKRFAKYLNDYFPHYALKDPDFDEKATLLAQKLWNSDVHRERMQGLGAASASDQASINYAGSQMLKPHVGGGLLSKNAHLERARGTIARPYREDPEVLMQYLDAAARSIAQAETWDRNLAVTPGAAGPSFHRERLGGLFDDLQQIHQANPGKKGEIAGLQQALERELGVRSTQEPTKFDALAADTRDFLASSQLALSFVTQTGSISDTANVMGWKGAATALKAMSSDVAERNAVRAGSVSARSERAARETAKLLRGAGGTGETSIVGKWTRGHKFIGPDAVWMDAMTTIDRKQRIGADAAARAHLPELHGELVAGKASTKKLLNAMSVSEKLQTEIAALDPRMIERHAKGLSVPRETERVIDAYARRMTDFTQQRPTPANLPPSWSTERGRWLTMFMPFGLRQTQNMGAAIIKNPVRFLTAGVPAYLLAGGIINAAKGLLSGYGVIGQNDDVRTFKDKLQQVLSNRPIQPGWPFRDDPEAVSDTILRATQALLATAPKPFALTMGERLERGLESKGEAAKAILGAGGALVNAPSALLRGISGAGKPEDQSGWEYAGRGALAAAGHLGLPSTYSYQLERELMPPEGGLAKKFRPTHKPGAVGRAFDVPSEAKRVGAMEAAKNFIMGSATGLPEYLSPWRQKRMKDVAKNKKVMKKAAERAERKRNYVPQTLPTYGGGT